MAKYHINGDSVSPCKAEKGQCPYGGGTEENHFDDAGEAMKVLEERLEAEHGGSNAPAVSKSKPAQKTAKELAAGGADGKEVRDALRKENPGWNDRQVHTVYGHMARSAQKQSASSAGTPARPKAPKTRADKPNKDISAVEVKNMLSSIKTSRSEREALEKELRANDADMKAYDSKHGAAEGRAYYYDYKQGFGKIEGVNPNGSTHFTMSDEQKAKRDDLIDRLQQTHKDEEDAQTIVEESGNGHLIPDEGNTIRVNNQAQKWLLKNELQGQISDGHWENASNNPWQDWSNAKVVVDPNNVGRNFNTTKDNYQLNSKTLLDVVGDRMIDDVKDRTGRDDYDMKTMNEDLRDLRKIFKTKRGVLN